MKLERLQQLCTALPPDRVLRLAKGVLKIADENNLTTYQILCLSLANWSEGYGICNEAQTMLLFNEYEKQLTWYANEIDELLGGTSYTIDTPLLVMLHDYRYFILQKPDHTEVPAGFFDIRESARLEELPETTVTYISVDCIALMAKVRSASKMIDRLEQEQRV